MIDRDPSTENVPAAFERAIDEGSERCSRSWLVLTATGAVGGFDVGVGVQTAEKAEVVKVPIPWRQVQHAELPLARYQLSQIPVDQLPDDEVNNRIDCVRKSNRLSRANHSSRTLMNRMPPSLAPQARRRVLTDRARSATFGL